MPPPTTMVSTLGCVLLTGTTLGAVHGSGERVRRTTPCTRAAPDDSPPTLRCGRSRRGTGSAASSPAGGKWEFRPDGALIPEAAPPLTGNAESLVEMHTRARLHIDHTTITPNWDGDNLDVDYVLSCSCYRSGSPRPREKRVPRNPTQRARGRSGWAWRRNGSTSGLVARDRSGLAANCRAPESGTAANATTEFGGENRRTHPPVARTRCAPDHSQRRRQLGSQRRDRRGDQARPSAAGSTGIESRGTRQTGTPVQSTAHPPP